MKFALLCLILWLPAGLFAQIAWGIKLGFNGSGTQSDNVLVVRNKPKVGWQAGVHNSSMVAGWGYWLEAQVITMGSVQEFADEVQRNTIGYLQVPFALSYRLAGKTAVSFYLGAYGGMRLWARRKTTKAGVGDFEANIRDNVAWFDYGFLAGAAVSLGRFTLDLRPTYGLIDSNTNPQLNVRARNVSGQLSVLYRIR